MSTFSGFIEEIAGISIDSFSDENTSRSTAFFLSHCHSDHMNGLNGLNFASHISSKPNQFLYCSAVTARLLQNMLRDNESVLRKVKPLDLGPNFVQVPIKDSDYHSNLVVTLLPAGHCLGSCMFLLESKTSTVLYTGDFRFCTKDLPKMTHLHTSSKDVKPLDSIYLDTTFWSQANGHFPSRQQSLDMIVESIEKFMRKTANVGHIHIDKPARIGSEFFIMELHRKFGKKIHVSPDSYNTYEGIEEVLSCLTLGKNDTFLHMCQNFRPGQRSRKLPCVASYVNVLHIRPTAQWYSVGEEYYPLRHDEANDLIQISNSMHASRNELIEFIQYFKPKKVIPCVVPKNSLMQEVQEEIDAILDECQETYGSRKRKLNLLPGTSSGKKSNHYGYDMMTAGFGEDDHEDD